MNEIDNALFVCSLYKLIISSKGSDDLSIDFHRDITTREVENGLITK